MNEINRVFFHELGHFVARELNRKHFGGIGTGIIEIEQCSETEFCGKTKPIGHEYGEIRPVRFKNFPETLARLSYGCIYQTYYLNQEIADCFKINGFEDMKSIRDGFTQFNLKSIENNLDWLNQNHLEFLRQNKALENFMKLEPMHYLQDQGNNLYLVDLEKLRSDIGMDIDAHFDHYKRFVEDIQKIIDSY